MPTWLAIVLIALAALIVILLAGGALAARRRSDARGDALAHELAAANEALAHARAQDRGWDRDAIDAAARAAHVAGRPAAQVRAVHLLQVVDRPGTADDEVRVRIVDEAGAHEVRLGRHGDDWVAAG